MLCLSKYRVGDSSVYRNYARSVLTVSFSIAPSSSVTTTVLSRLPVSALKPKNAQPITSEHITRAEQNALAEVRRGKARIVLFLTGASFILSFSSVDVRAKNAHARHEQLCINRLFFYTYGFSYHKRGALGENTSCCHHSELSVNNR